MTKRKIEFEMTLDTKIEGGKTLQAWALFVGVPVAQAVAVADLMLAKGIWRAVPSVQIEFVSDPEKEPPQIEPKRRGRRTKAQIALDTAEAEKPASEPQNQSKAIPQKPNGRAANNPDELTWDVRMRSVSQMGREWDSDWGPAPGEYGCKCPASILSKYGVA